MRNEAIFFIEKLLNYYSLSSLQELAEKLKIKQSSLSSWKSRNSVNAIKKKCRELGIYNEIFGDLNTNINNQIIRDNLGNLSQTGNVYDSKNNNENNLNFDEAALAMFKRAYNKCLDEDGQIIEDKIDGLIAHLMRFK
ncbi:helix-turn-helix domain-containing protein [Aliarcobacter butzleri]|uniref:helix-turn-helix domain-containing protein n=1 Tax=Aliarcobacter butzleri TaxID=28197 RepID=UPI001EDA1358|nr:helix-turn-helix domain-containing protein [Aliarcobacter butzleri]MCG3693456.1 helix-turn-helix domain containing protein [Aliarcobacter butzleri]